MYSYSRRTDSREVTRKIRGRGRKGSVGYSGDVHYERSTGMSTHFHTCCVRVHVHRTLFQSWAFTPGTASLPLRPPTCRPLFYEHPQSFIASRLTSCSFLVEYPCSPSPFPLSCHVNPCTRAPTMSAMLLGCLIRDVPLSPPQRCKGLVACSSSSGRTSDVASPAGFLFRSGLSVRVYE